ncbi:hypothetical protein H1R20_g5666, partial [Candolleomyces eurysporus]
MSSGATAQDKTWKDRETASEADYAHRKEREQLEAIRSSQAAASTATSDSNTNTGAAAGAESSNVPREDRPYEAGFGGQEDLEDRYATTSGEH